MNFLYTQKLQAVARSSLFVSFVGNSCWLYYAAVLLLDAVQALGCLRCFHFALSCYHT